MTHVIFDLCIRDGACVEVCPVECIIPGQPESEWPWYYIDPDTCIDCGACVPECPFEAIFPEEDVPEEFELKSGQEYRPIGSTEKMTAEGGEVLDLTTATKPNYDFFTDGPGYDALDM